MKKLFISVLTLICAATMSAQITADVTLRLESASNSASELYLFAGPDLAANPERGGFFATQSNPEDINIYAVDPATNGKYSSYGDPILVNIPIEIITSKEAEAQQSYTIHFEVFEDAYALKLKDLVTGTETAITNGGSYAFSISSDPTSPNYTPGYAEGSYSTIANRFVINYTYVIMNGDFADPNGSWAYTSNFTHNGATASLDLTLAADTWYHFQIEENGAIGANGSAFDEDHKSFVVPTTGWDQQLTLHTGAAGTYTFTWTYASDNLAITFPAPAAGYDVTLNAYGLATFSADANGDAEIPSGLKAYTATYVALTEVLNLSQITSGKIPAGAGVILYGEPNAAVTLPYTTGAAAISGTNHLQPSASFAAADDIYVLSGNMMYQYTESDALPANKAFLKLPGGAPAPRRITLHFDEAQGVENVGVDVKAQKFIGEDGQIYLRRGNEVYNLQGQIVK